MKVVAEIGPLNVDTKGLTQVQVELLRQKINELCKTLGLTAYVQDSTALKVLGGNQRNAPVLPRGMTNYTFLATSTPEEVSHGLDRVPTGYLVIRAYPQPTVPIGDASLADWNTKTAWLSGEAGVNVTILWF